MFSSLYARLSIALVGLFLATGVLYILISGAVTERYLQEITQSFNRDLAQRILEGDSSSWWFDKGSDWWVRGGKV
jgi:hypothetical protein